MSPFYNFHIFSFSLGFISGFNNHLINIHLTIFRKILKLAQLYPEYIIIFIIKILGYFWGVTSTLQGLHVGTSFVEFRQLREVGVFSYLFYSLAKSHFNG